MFMLFLQTLLWLLLAAIIGALIGWFIRPFFCRNCDAEMSAAGNASLRTSGTAGVKGSADARGSVAHTKTASTSTAGAASDGGKASSGGKAAAGAAAAVAAAGVAAAASSARKQDNTEEKRKAEEIRQAEIAKAKAAEEKRKADEAAKAAAAKQKAMADAEATKAAAAKRKADEAAKAAQARKEAEAKAAKAAEEKRKIEEAARAAGAKRKAEADAAARAAEEKRKAEAAAEAKRRADAEATAQAADEKRRAEAAEAKRKTDAAAAEAKRKADADAAARAADAKRQADAAAEAKRKADAAAADAKRKAEADAAARAAEAKRQADANAADAAKRQADAKLEEERRRARDAASKAAATAAAAASVAAAGAAAASSGSSTGTSGSAASDYSAGITDAMRPSRLAAPQGGKADDLKRIKGVGPVIEKTLNGEGVYHFQQVADFDDNNVRWVNNHISFPGRIEREDWIGQAKSLARGEAYEGYVYDPNSVKISEDMRPTRLMGAEGGKADDLKRIKGIGPVIEKTLNDEGVYHYRQIASFTPRNTMWVDNKIAFPGRIHREDWIGQAKALDSGRAYSGYGLMATEDGDDNAGSVTANMRPKRETLAAGAKGDDLKVINGIGPVIEETLNDEGVYYYRQIANFDDNNVRWVDNHISFPGRIHREDWIAQAKRLVGEQGDGAVSDTMKPTLLSQPNAGGADDLKRIKGIGKVLEKTLHDLGVYHYRQIAEFTPDNVKWVNHHLAFPGRIERENWIEQARNLAAGKPTEYSDRFDDGDTPYKS